MTSRLLLAGATWDLSGRAAANQDASHLGIPVVYPHLVARPWTSLDVDRMALLYGQGHTVDQIGTELGVNARTVHRRLRAAGVQMRPPGVARLPVTDEEILRLRGQGLLWREVGDRVGMTTPGVHRRWRQLRDAGHTDPMPTGGAKAGGPIRRRVRPRLGCRLIPVRHDAAAGRGSSGLHDVDGLQAAEAAGIPARKRGGPTPGRRHGDT